MHLQAHVYPHFQQQPLCYFHKDDRRINVLATQVFQSARLCHICFFWYDSPAALNFMSSCKRRITNVPVRKGVRWIVGEVET